MLEKAEETRGGESHPTGNCFFDPRARMRGAVEGGGVSGNDMGNKSGEE